MMNRIAITSTKFVNVKTKRKTLGFRIYDCEGQTYENTWEDIPDKDLDVLKKVMESNNKEVVSMLGLLKDSENGIDIDDTWYDWDEIQHLFV
jgi:hypothetical protein